MVSWAEIQFKDNALAYEMYRYNDRFGDHDAGWLLNATDILKEENDRF